MDNLRLPKPVEIILNRLQESGYQAYIIGGCVRDSIMEITPHDWDICTSASPEQIVEVFSDYEVIPTGLQHGTVTVIINNTGFEITAYRIDGAYNNGIHPDDAQSVYDIKLDLMHRDFTINALAYNHDSGIIDYFNGIEDVQNKVIRCVGDPNDRFAEDALRIMRAIRFAIKYGFEIDCETRNALIQHRMSLSNISMERINSEIVKVLQCDLKGKEASLNDFITLLSVLVPEFGETDISEIVERLSNCCSEYEVRLALLFDFDDKDIDTVLKRLQFSNDTIKYVITISKYGRLIRDDHSWWPHIDATLPSKKYNKSDYYARKLLHEILFEPALFSIDYARAFAKENSSLDVMLKILDLQVGYAVLHKEPYQLSDLEIDGDDLVKLGYSGKQIGKILNTLLDMVMRDVVENNYIVLINAAKSMKELVL